MIRTKGDLCGLSVRAEAVYGTVGSGASEYGGHLISMDTGDGAETDALIQCGSRLDGQRYVVSTSCRPNFSVNQVRYNSESNPIRWTKWLERCLHLKEADPPSMTIGFRASSVETHVLTGTTVDSVKIGASQVGGKLQFDVGAISRLHSMIVNGTPYNAQDSGAADMGLVTAPSGIPVTYNSFWTLGGNPIRAKSWSLSVSQGLVPDAGVSSASSALEAGSGAYAQDLEIVLELTVASDGPSWDILRLTDADGPFSPTITIDGATVTLTGCSIDPAGPQRSSAGSYDETVRFTAQDISWS